MADHAGEHGIVAARARPSDWERTAWLIFGGLAAPLTTLYFFMPTALSKSALYDVIGFLSVVAIVVGIRLHRPDRPLPWWLFAAGNFLSVGADAMWTAHAAFIGGDPPFPWYADAVYLASYPLFALGLLAIVRLRRAGHDRDALLDALMVAVGAGAVSWVFLMGPRLHDETLGLFGQIVALSYPAMDIVLLGVAVRFIASGGLRRPSLSMILGAVAVLVVADAGYMWEMLAGTYHSGNPIDIGWLLSYALFGVAALHPSMCISDLPQHDETARFSHRRLAILGIVALAGPTVLAVREAQGVDIAAPVLLGASATLFLLALVRVGTVAVRLNHALEARGRADARVAASEERFRGAFFHAPIGMALVDRDGRWRQVNRALCEMLGYDEAEMLATTWAAVTHPGDLAEPRHVRRIENGEPAAGQIERRFLRRDGRVVWTVQAVSAAPSAMGEPGHAIWQVQDVTARKELEEELRRLALHDPLTGLPNRTLFADRLARALEAGHRGEFVGVLFMDLDRFKVVNDSLGHAAGDRLLCAAAKRLTNELRVEDTLSRFGGDEFVALLEDLPDPAAASRLAERLLDALQEPFSLDGQEAVVSASIGVAVGAANKSRPDDLLRHADMALYRAKSAGRSTYAVFDAGMDDEAARRLAMEIDLRRAVDRGELVLRYQPIVDLANDRIVGAEALVRWAHPARGLVAPVEFIDLAEETGLIVQLGARVLEEACRQAAAWQPRDSSEPPLVMCVNLSGRQVRDPGLVETVAGALRSSGLRPEELRLELTERVLIEEGPATAATLRALNALGVALAIDDFGMGYSSLGSLRHLPVETLKIDRSFVDGLGRDQSAEAIVDAVVALARALHLTVTAEGIETPAQLAHVRASGCDLAQGFLFGPPVTAEAFEMHLFGGAQRARRTWTPRSPEHGAFDWLTQEPGAA